MWHDLVEAIKAHDFGAVNDMLAGIDYLTLFKNPWVLAVMGVVCLIFIIRGMEKALVTFLSMPALMILFQKTAQGSTALDFDAEKLLIFVGGCIAIAAVNVYFYLVRK